MKNYISRLEAIPVETLAPMIDDLRSSKIPWSENYAEYHSSGWKTVALYNQNGDPLINDLVDCRPVPTAVLSELPAIREYLEHCPYSLMWARILRMEPGTYLWEHTDYGDLQDTPRLRLHVPLITNPEALMVFDEEAVHMQSGYLWKLDPKRARHAAYNGGTESRTHLIMDCYVDQPLLERIRGEYLDDNSRRRFPQFEEQDFAMLSRDARALLEGGKQQEAEQLFLKTFHSFYLKNASSYDLLVRFYDQLGDRERRNHWIEQKKGFLNL